MSDLLDVFWYITDESLPAWYWLKCVLASCTLIADESLPAWYWLNRVLASCTWCSTLTLYSCCINSASKGLTYIHYLYCSLLSPHETHMTTVLIVFLFFFTTPAILLASVKEIEAHLFNVTVRSTLHTTSTVSSNHQYINSYYRNVNSY